MSYEVSWYVNNRVILCKLSEEITVDEIKTGNTKIREYVAEGENPVHCILDLNDLNSFPIDFNLFRTDYPFHDTTGWIVLSGGNALMRYSAGVVARFIGTDFHVVRNFDEALTFLKEKDSTIQTDTE